MSQQHHFLPEAGEVSATPALTFLLGWWACCSQTDVASTRGSAQWGSLQRRQQPGSWYIQHWVGPVSVNPMKAAD